MHCFCNSVQLLPVFFKAMWLLALQMFEFSTYQRVSGVNGDSGCAL